MKKYLQQAFAFASAVIVSSVTGHLTAQTLEWKLINPVYSSADPDGAGPATGSVSFTMQIHTQSAASVPITGLSTGWAYQSAKAMIPTAVGCPASPVSSPVNVSVAAGFTAAGFSYSFVNQCGVLANPISTGGQTFDRRAVGTLDGPNSVTLTPTWIDVFTVTLWTLGSTTPQGGFAVLNSGDGGTPAPFSSYAASDANANQFSVNSLTYATPLSIGAALPITLSKFNAACTGTGSLLSWETVTEINNDHFEIEKSSDGNTGWTVIGSVKGAGSTNTARQYKFTDATATGTSYYRLKQVDIDGKFSYSSIEKTDCQNRASQLVVYPVPAKDVLNMVISTEKSSKASIMLVDVSGKTVRQLNTDLQKGTNSLKITVSGLASGTYFLKVAGTDVIKTQKVTIVR